MLFLLLACGEDTKEELDTAVEDTAVENTDTNQSVDDQEVMATEDGDCNDEDANIFPLIGANMVQ